MNKLQKSFYYSLLIVAILLPWNSKTTYVAIGAASCLWLILFGRHLRFVESRTWLKILSLGSLLIIQLIGLVYSHNLTEGIFRIETRLALFVLPLIILASNANKEMVSRIVLIFSLSTVFACLWCEFNIFMLVSTNQDAVLSVFSKLEYQSVFLTAYLAELHPTFMSIFCCVGIAHFFFQSIPNIPIKADRGIRIATIVFLFLFIFQLTSIVGFAAVTITVTGILIYKFRDRIMLLVTAFIIMVVIVSGVVTSAPGWRARVIESFNNSSLTTDDLSNSISMHYKSWYCAITQWRKGNIWIGYGTGDEKDLIRACYFQNHWTDLGQDAHNEYLSSLVRHGIIGLLILLISLAVPLWYSVKNGRYQFSIFILMMALSFCAESVFRAGIGPVFFAFFMSLWMVEDNQVDH